MLLADAAQHLLQRFLVPLGLRGACYYSSLALRHQLAAKHQVDVATVAGFVRAKDTAWASHMWVELDGRRTDIALHYPNPPVTPGPLVIDGKMRAPGAEFLYSAARPADGFPVLIDAPGPENARRQAEHARFVQLAVADIGAVEEYLAGAPGGLFGRLQHAWASFRPTR